MTRSAIAALPPNIDHYPSRKSPRPSISLRRDPVVYGRAENGPLSEATLREYEQNGYLFFPSLFTPEETGELLQEIEALKACRQTIPDDYSIREPESGDIRSFFHIHTYNARFRALAAEARLLGIIGQILGSKLYLHQSRINLKPGFRGKEFFWHSDFETWHTEDGMPEMRALSCTINLTENTAHNGPLMVIPGSHRSFISCVGETPEHHYRQSLRRQEYGVPDEQSITELAQQNGIVSFTGPPGSVVLFDCNILHGSAGNITPWPRTNVFFVYNSILNILRAPYCGLPPRPEHIAARARCETL